MAVALQDIKFLHPENSIPFSSPTGKPYYSMTIGTKFGISATVVNNGGGVITYIGGPCDSPIDASFDSTAISVVHGIRCLAMAMPKSLQPGQHTSVVGPGSGISYTAAKSGKVTATITFHYNVDAGGGNLKPMSVSAHIPFVVINNRSGLGPPLPIVKPGGPVATVPPGTPTRTTGDGTRPVVTPTTIDPNPSSGDAPDGSDTGVDDGSDVPATTPPGLIDLQGIISSPIFLAGAGLLVVVGVLKLLKL